MTNLNKVLKHFNNDLQEWVTFLNEKINDGQEISRGKDPNDTSKQEKADEQPQEGDMAMGDMPPGGDAGAVAPMPPVIDPSMAPGSQISIGKKAVKAEADPDSVRIKISGQKEKIDMKPRVNTLPVNGTY
jgi:hypothetical protein